MNEPFAYIEFSILAMKWIRKIRGNVVRGILYVALTGIWLSRYFSDFPPLIRIIGVGLFVFLLVRLFTHRE